MEEDPVIYEEPMYVDVQEVYEEPVPEAAPVEPAMTNEQGEVLISTIASIQEQSLQTNRIVAELQKTANLILHAIEDNTSMQQKLAQ